jgi:tripartite ATP-independent transporter DctM subunit
MESIDARAATQTTGSLLGARARPWPLALFSSVENALLVIALASIVLVPLLESGLRATLETGISGSNSIVQHLTLVIGMLGGAVAAREGKLLSLSTADAFLRGTWRTAARLFSHATAAAVAAFLCAASVEFVSIEREVGKILAYDVPVWVVQSVLPIGFALIALRLLWGASSTLTGRAIALAITGIFVWIGASAPIDPASMRVPALVILGLATLAGAPVFVTLGGAALILFWSSDSPIASIPLDHYRLVTNPTLPTIPLFTLAGYFMAEGGASKRLIRVFQALFGRVRGGPAIVTALVCAFFTSFTGASGVTILALGGLLMPILVSARYSERDALGMITGAGSLGLLFPPSLPLILYAIISKVTIEEMFLGGILPGFLLVALTAWWGVRRGPRVDQATGDRFDAREAWRSVWDAKWELLLPVVALVSLFSGRATPVEAAAVTALYAFVVECVIYRDLSVFKGVPRVSTVMVECGLLIGGVLMILGVALGFTNYLIDAEVPAKALEWVTSSVHSPLLFLLYLNLFLLVVGCLMDVFSAIIVVVPLIVPMGEAFHIDPVHLGIIFLANLELGFLTPPVGMNLFLASYRLNKPMPEVIRAVVPMLIVLLVGVLLITYVPALTTWLPALVRG